MTVSLDATDRALINRLQEDLPLVEHPFAEVGKALGIGEDEVIDRLRRLRECGVLTRFGPFFDAEALGGAFCLCAMAVPRACYEAVAATVNALPEVAHNYARDHHLNMWFVLATETAAGIAFAADRIERETGIAVLRFPKEREFFIGFRVAA